MHGKCAVSRDCASTGRATPRPDRWSGKLTSSSTAFGRYAWAAVSAIVPRCGVTMHWKPISCARIAQDGGEAFVVLDDEDEA